MTEASSSDNPSHPSPSVQPPAPPQARPPSISLDPVSLDPSEEPALSWPQRSTQLVRSLAARVGGPIAARLPAPLTSFAAGDLADERAVIRSGRLAGLSMNAAIFVMAWPILTESALNSLVGLVDTALAAGLSQAATDAVGGAAYVLWFLGLITMAIGVGATAIISRAMGAGRPHVARAALGQAVTLASIGGVLVAAAMFAAAPAVGAVLSMQGQTLHDFTVYMRAMSLGVPFSTIMFAAIACARGLGDTLRPLLVMCLLNVVNMVVSWSLAGVDLARTDAAGVRHVLIDNPFNFNLGILGIGLGTAFAQMVGCALILWFHIKGRSGIALRRFWMRPHRVTIARMVRLGLPNFFETFGMWLGNFLIILMVGWLALTAPAVAVSDASAGLLGAHLIAIRIEALSFLPGFAMGVASGALAGQYLGAGRPDLARTVALRCALFAAALMGLVGFAFIFGGSFLVSLISQQPAHLALAPKLLFITGLVQVPFALAIVFRSTMHGAGDVRAVMLMTWFSTWGLRLPLAYAISGVAIPLGEGRFLPNPFGPGWGLPGLWVGLCTEIALRCIVYSARFAHGGWVKARV
ncbi:MAG: MATE family efflux transporter [Planctomycetaceae bacterium]|jgi:putative MATE family efflux protein|nr:MATE family efflux transporter [Phycisphaerales bacterium]MCE2652242.1 MATE family efflux transporter [Planctomycetaceae bacterium]